MTRPEKLTYTQGLEARIVELEEQVARQSARILVLAGVDPTSADFPPLRLNDLSPGLTRMARGMKVPADIKPTACPTTSPMDGKSPSDERPGVLRMAAGLTLPRA